MFKDTPQDFSKNDPFGNAINEFEKNKIPKIIRVSSDLCDDDELPIKYLFRTHEEMPPVEKKALELCEGKILDAGAGAGAHLKILKDRGFSVFALDVSPGAIKHLQKHNIPCALSPIQNFETKERYDTLLLMMNGIGISEKLEALKSFLAKCKSLLTENGQILLDSTDIKYLYEDEDDSIWIDLNSSYYGEFQFQMHFNGESGPFFNWLYVDFETLKTHARMAGLSCEKIFEDGDHYLAKLKP
tara:strand:+ start:317 stop:1045 length:729 start_codon:yes stop_codon:yes gene_type:complete